MRDFQGIHPQLINRNLPPEIAEHDLITIYELHDLSGVAFVALSSIDSESLDVPIKSSKHWVRAGVIGVPKRSEKEYFQLLRLAERDHVEARTCGVITVVLSNENRDATSDDIVRD